MKAAQIATVLLYVIPLWFLFAVLCLYATEWFDARREEREYNPGTESIVLMLLGLAFLCFNARFVPIVAEVAEQQMKAIPTLYAPFIGAAYGFTAVVLVAAFSKAFWTHINLEDGRWGPAKNYREGLEKRPMIASVEFLLRLVIAFLVIFLQEHIAEAANIDGIQQAARWHFQNDAAATTFIFRYDHWLAGTALLGMLFFAAILIWLFIAYPHNKKRSGSLAAFFGTLTFAVPGLLLSWSLNYLATGSALPSLNSGPPDTTMIATAADLLLLLAAVVLLNLVYTLFRSTVDVFRELGFAYRSNKAKLAAKV